LRFEKKVKTTISDDELGALQTLAEYQLARIGQSLDTAAIDGALRVICHDE